ncbi:hypothetical protein K505DRAFT_89217 [Melanomma pulvis-pyrius CBS 109.77]|uniref:Uncharacterized protein n=1 Tax=Melanomma pulvis-pyrius CBS 109.77 TaxID=1314802 RepID=A0A6A6X0B6_9PLEO|nr:hypothetical protein K505DRAFT_89217 [Melanomma pulvis-pyrius CBS 109.77]
MLSLSWVTSNLSLSVGIRQKVLRGGYTSKTSSWFSWAGRRFLFVFKLLFFCFFLFFFLYIHRCSLQLPKKKKNRKKTTNSQRQHSKLPQTTHNNIPRVTANHPTASHTKTTPQV